MLCFTPRARDERTQAVRANWLASKNGGLRAHFQPLLVLQCSLQELFTHGLSRMQFLSLRSCRLSLRRGTYTKLPESTFCVKDMELPAHLEVLSGRMLYFNQRHDIFRFNLCRTSGFCSPRKCSLPKSLRSSSKCS